MNKTVIITGASGNLGKATVEKFVSDGYTVVAAVIPGTTLGFFENHPNVISYLVDLTNETETEKFVNTVVQKYNSIEAALLLVGGYSSGSIKDTTGEDLKKMYALNFETAYFVARPVFNQMIKQMNGRIVLTGARAALHPEQGKNSIAYSLSKSLIFELAGMLNAEGAAHNVTTTVIVPSIIDTPVNRQSMPNADFSAWVKPEEIADIIALAVSDATAVLREPVMKVYGRS